MKNVKATGTKKVEYENKSIEPEKKDYKINVEITEKVKAKSINNGMGDRLKEAFIWSEILGPPLSKRKKRRYDGY